MRTLIISDIHANLASLKAVLADAGDFEAVWCLGDLVGYGPDPNECVELVRGLPNLLCILGNHDAAALGLIETEAFNPDARLALEWTRRVLTMDALNYLHSLPETVVAGAATLVHGSPRQPIWEYLLDSRSATINFDYFDTPYCFVGHTHLPALYLLTDENLTASLNVPEDSMKAVLTPRAIVNPGSVGQPRDRDPRAAYGIYEPEHNTFEFRRVSYDIPRVQERMAAARLPERHIQRLSAGW